MEIPVSLFINLFEKNDCRLRKNQAPEISLPPKKTAGVIENIMHTLRIIEPSKEKYQS